MRSHGRWAKGASAAVAGDLGAHLPSGRRFSTGLQDGTSAPSSQTLRVVHFSVQHDHVHPIVEADDARSLARGMQAMTIRFARGINKALDRSGKVFVDRYHAQQLRTPTQVRNAIRYVLSNARKHLAENGIRVRARFVDPFSSAPHRDARFA